MEVLNVDGVIRRCTANDVSLLKDISCKTFSETFSYANDPDELQAFLDNAYNIPSLKQELENEFSQFYFLYSNEEVAGYLKVNEAPAQTEFNDKESLEIQRIYLLNKFQGKGFGGQLIKKGIDLALERGKSYVWLGVWEHNEKAIGFYKNYGFYRIGEHSFFVGNDEQTDYLLRKDLADTCISGRSKYKADI